MVGSHGPSSPETQAEWSWAERSAGRDVRYSPRGRGGPQGSGEGRSDPRPTPTPRRTVKADPVPGGSISRAVVVVKVVPVGAGGRGGGGTNLLPPDTGRWRAGTSNPNHKK